MTEDVRPEGAMVVDSSTRVRAAVVASLESMTADVGVVNLVGPVGVGKSSILDLLATVYGTSGGGGHGHVARLPDGGSLMLLDSADCAEAVASVAADLRAAAPKARAVVASRRPLRSWSAWPSCEPWTIDTVAVSPWSPSEIREFVRRIGLTDQDSVDLTVRLSGGIPMIAESLAKALLSGLPQDATGAIVHDAATRTLRRLRREQTDVPDEALVALAVLGIADEDLLRAATPGIDRQFDALARCSVVSADPLGLAVVEPYRSLLELHDHWRRPLSYHAILTKGVRQRYRQIIGGRHSVNRVRLAEHALFLTGDPQLRRTLFPSLEPPGGIRPARPDDEELIRRMVAQWASRGELDQGRCDRLLDQWLATSPSGFHLAVDPHGSVVGITNLIPLASTALPALDPLLQQHAPALFPSDPAATPGVLVAMAYAAPEASGAHAMVLRHVLRTAITCGNLVVSTPWRPYQQLAARVGLRHVGATAHDVYRCGRPTEIFSGSFQDHLLPTWLRVLAGSEADVPIEPAQLLTGVREALSAITDPARVARSPLLAIAGISDARHLCAMLRCGIEALAASPSGRDAEAGQVLIEAYLRPGPQHRHADIAHRLHLSRATYYRRMDHGISRLAQMLMASALNE